jgi:galactose mutarotase-like enzyme
MLAAHNRRLELRFDSGYPFTQIYAPGDLAAVAIEPMTAPTNALLTGGPELTLVPPGETFAANFSISVL